MSVLLIFIFSLFLIFRVYIFKVKGSRTSALPKVGTYAWRCTLSRQYVQQSTVQQVTDALLGSNEDSMCCGSGST